MAFLFADDSSLFRKIVDGNIAAAVHDINYDLEKINSWAKQWLVQINASKTVVMLFSRKTSPSQLPAIILDGAVLKLVKSHKHLGITLMSSLSWTEHIDLTSGKSNRVLGMLKRFKYRWSRATLEICYKSFIRPIIEYGNIIYDLCTIADSDKLESVQLAAARLVTGAKKGTSHEPLYRELGWQT